MAISNIFCTFALEIITNQITSMTTENSTYDRPLIEQELEYYGKEIQHLMSDYPCMREICKGLETAAYPAATIVLRSCAD